MTDLTPLAEIHVPDPQPDAEYRTSLLGKSFSFAGLKSLLGAADASKAGDRVAGLASPDELTREAARTILAGLTLEELYERPLVADDGQVDSIMRVNYDVDRAALAECSSLTLSQFKDRLLSGSSAEVSRWGRGLTGPMAAAVAKLCDVHCLGAGDCLIGVNPAVDTVANVGGLLGHLHKVRSQLEVPTQICVLAHLKTPLACLREGRPVEILFQSLAGTDRTLIEEFDVTVELLDRGYCEMREHGPLAGLAENWMNFETGQGSELTYRKHNGIDMATCEALCYGLARRYRPFMVNNVTGFIGPETHLDNHEMILSNLQDHLMGKLLGLPMGMAPCYTLHSQISMEGHQMATQLLTAAGANYYMDVFLTVDRMLAYFDTSGHDVQTLREIHDLQPSAEYLDWAIERGIFVRDGEGRVSRGPNWGRPRIFCESDAEYQRLLEAVPSVYRFEHAGPRPADGVSRELRANLAVGREAIYSDLDRAQLGDFELREVATAAADHAAHLQDPNLGTRLSAKSSESLSAEHCDVQIVISDGLSAEAVHHNIPDLLPVLLDGLASRELQIGTPLLARYGRVKLAESVGDVLEPQLVIMLIGERPGGDAVSSRSLSAYFAYRLTNPEVQRQAAEFSGNPRIRYEYTVLSNIHSGALPAVEAGSVVARKAIEILDRQAAGNRLESLLQGAAARS